MKPIKFFDLNVKDKFCIYPISNGVVWTKIETKQLKLRTGSMTVNAIDEKFIRNENE